MFYFSESNDLSVVSFVAPGEQDLLIAAVCRVTSARVSSKEHVLVLNEAEEIEYDEDRVQLSLKGWAIPFVLDVDGSSQLDLSSVDMEGRVEIVEAISRDSQFTPFEVRRD